MAGMKHNIIMLGNNMQQGKDTLADRITDTNTDVIKFNFASRMKTMVGELYGMSEDQLYTKLKEAPDHRYPKGDGSFWTPREILIKFGQEQNSVTQHIWADIVFRQIDTLLKSRMYCTDFIIADLRFRFEIDAAFKWKKHFESKYPNDSFEIIPVKIKRPDYNRWCFDKSEIDLDDYDGWKYVVLNDSSLGSFLKKADDLYNHIKKEGR